MGYYAIVIGEDVDSIAVADHPLGDLGQWIDVSNLNPRPNPGWKYINGQFTPPPEPIVLVANTQPAVG